jgi:hypothetical protein
MTSNVLVMEGRRGGREAGRRGAFTRKTVYVGARFLREHREPMEREAERFGTHVN